MPGNLDLCVKLGVKPSPSDPLTHDDLRSAKTTRMALHRELIKRRPGLYPRRWLARRLGVCVRTTQDYDRESSIHSVPMYLDTFISWSRLHHIPDFEVPGTFLQDETGKRYPAKQGIARHLLSQGHLVRLRRRDCNYYYYGDAPPDRGVALGLRPDRELSEARQQQVQAFVRQYEHQAEKKHDRVLQPLVQQPLAAAACAETQHTAVHPAQELTNARPSEEGQPVSPKPVSKRHYRKPLADPSAEALARRVHAETGAQASSQGMSLRNARRLVDTYGLKPVETALKRMVWLRGKGKISNPAGFLVVASRVAWRVQHGATELGMPAPRFRGERARAKRTTAGWR